VTCPANNVTANRLSKPSPSRTRVARVCAAPRSDTRRTDASAKPALARPRETSIRYLRRCRHDADRDQREATAPHRREPSSTTTQLCSEACALSLISPGPRSPAHGRELLAPAIRAAASIFPRSTASRFVIVPHADGHELSRPVGSVTGQFLLTPLFTGRRSRSAESAGHLVNH